MDEDAIKARGKLRIPRFANPASYRQINSDAHRLRSLDLGTPSITWHMAFWIPQPSAERHINRNIMRASLDRAISRLFNSLKEDESNSEVSVDPNVQYDIEGNKVHALVLFRRARNYETLKPLAPHLYSKRVSDILQSDTRAVVIRFKRRKLSVRVRIEVQTEYFTITVLVSGLTKLLITEDDQGSAKESVDKLKQVTFDRLNERFWGYFAGYIFGLDRSKENFLSKRFSQIFIDIRGVIIGYKPLDRALLSAPSPSWAKPLIEKLRPIVTLDDRYECIANYMLDGQVLHLSSLGPQRPEHPDYDRIPITFLLLVQEIVNERQLGRLLDRMHVIGTVRLAALRNLKRLRRAGRQLAELDQAMIAARSTVEDYQKGRADEKKVSSTIYNIRHAVDNVSKAFVEGKVSFIETNGPRIPEDEDEDRPTAGISFRIEYSRYYVEQLRANIKTLRLSRVEGYQKYDQFVERRLGSTFDYIDRLGVRYERALASKKDIEQSYISIRASRTGVSIENIQRYGELILIGVLVPYYIVSGLHYVKESSPTFFAAIAIVYSYTTYNALKKFLHEKGRSEIESTSLGIRAGILVVSALAILLVVFQYHEIAAWLQDQGSKK